MPRLRNTLIIQGHSIRPSTIIEITNLLDMRPFQMEVLNIDDQTVQFRSKRPEQDEYHTTQTFNISFFTAAFQHFQINRITYAQA